MTPKLSQNQMSELKESYKKKLLNYMSRPQNSCEPYPNPNNSPLGPQNIKNDPKIKSKSNIRIIEKKKMKVVKQHE